MSGAGLRLVIVTPTEVLVDAPGVVSVRLRDASGSLGVLPGHADLVGVLPASVVRWREAPGGAWRGAAIGGGALRVTGGTDVLVACREGLAGTDPEALAARVADWRAAGADAERVRRVEDVALRAALLQRIADIGGQDGPGGPSDRGGPGVSLDPGPPEAGR